VVRPRGCGGRPTQPPPPGGSAAAGVGRAPRQCAPPPATTGWALSAPLTGPVCARAGASARCQHHPRRVVLTTPAGWCYITLFPAAAVRGGRWLALLPRRPRPRRGRIEPSAVARRRRRRGRRPRRGRLPRPRQRRGRLRTPQRGRRRPGRRRRRSVRRRRRTRRPAGSWACRGGAFVSRRR